jgi:hypothetical protein
VSRREFFAGTAAVAIAAAGATEAMAQEGSDTGIVGSSFGTVTATNPPLGQFNALISFHEGGVVTESRRYFVPVTPFGRLLETTGHGAWKRTSGHSFEAFFRFLLQNADTGNPVGTDNIRLSLTLDARNDSLTGTFVSQIKNESDQVVFQATGTVSATRITV